MGLLLNWSVIFVIRLYCPTWTKSQAFKFVSIEHNVHILSPLVDAGKIILEYLTVKNAELEKDGEPRNQVPEEGWHEILHILLNLAFRVTFFKIIQGNMIKTA